MSAKQRLCNAEWFDQQVDTDQMLLNTMKFQTGFQMTVEPKTKT